MVCAGVRHGAFSRLLKNTVLTAVQRNETALNHATAELRADRDFVTDAVQDNGKAWEFAHQSLRKDHVVVLIAAIANGNARRKPTS